MVEPHLLGALVKVPLRLSAVTAQSLPSVHGATGTTLSKKCKKEPQLLLLDIQKEELINPSGSMKNVCPYAQEYLPDPCPLYSRLIKVELT